MDIEQRALDRGAVALVRVDCGGYAMTLVTSLAYQLPDGEHWLMPVEAHDAFRQEVSVIASSALAMYQRIGEVHCPTAQALRPLIIQPKTDPLVEALRKAFPVTMEGCNEATAAELRRALPSCGLEIREVQP